MTLVPVHANEATAAQRRVYFDLRDGTDGITPETGEGGGQPQISTDGGAWTNTGIGTLTHIGNGRYYADLTQAATNITAGSRILTRFDSANTAETPGDTVIIYANDPFDNPTATALTAVDDLLDTEVAAIKTVVDAIKLSTDNLPSDPADASVVAGLIAALETKVDTIDNLLDTEMPALTAAVATVDGIVDAILVHTTELETRLTALRAANLDLITALASQATLDGVVLDLTAIQAALTTIDNFIDTEIAAIKAVTDQMVFTVANRLDVQVIGMAADSLTAAAIATDALGALELAAGAGTEIATAVAAAILLNPSNKLLTDPSGYVTATNGGSGGPISPSVRPVRLLSRC